jgi:ATP-dependent helicase/nuclease subunit A
MKRHVPFPPLQDKQALASDPEEIVWLSASAGTGKTQVLTARVLRLLLRGVPPETILCLTFTKAGAAEMAERIQQVLGAWVRLPGPLLFKDLQNLGEDCGPEAQARARTLFARVLDARGGGLRIQTIHSFCQTLLAGFPAEAGLAPGFRPIEGREEAALRQSVLADMVSDAARNGHPGVIERLQTVAGRLGEDGTRAFLARCAAAPDAMESLGPAQAIEVFVRRALSDGIDDIHGYLVARCDDAVIDRDGWARLRSMHGNWLTKAGQPRANCEEVVALITAWLAADPEARIERFTELRLIWRKQDGDWRKALPDDPGYLPLVESLETWLLALDDLRCARDLAPVLASALRLGQEYALAYRDAKRAHGVVDFNDMIRRTVALLATPGMGDWVRFKLDQATDHILIDEGQDTNAAQWDIVKALSAEFFAGDGAKADARRTLFVVGDYKQAIFGFQGTDPEQFNEARAYFDAKVSDADGTLRDLSLASSFRSSPPILDLVDATLDTLGHEAIGLPRPDPRHDSFKGGSGSITLWPAVGGGAMADPDTETAEDAEQWLDEAKLTFARTLAKRIKGWITPESTTALYLRNQGGRQVEPQDILILLRSRGDLARLIVSRLYEEGVPVAGVDRLRLNAPVAVMDLLAAIRFALQPLDDLNLAALLVSPLIGWSQQELYDRAFGRKAPLWRHLRATLSAENLAVPEAILAMADFRTPHHFLETILSGPIRGRAKLIERLGEEARDPIEELLNAALSFERDAPPTLQLFVDWFDRGDVEIKRDPSKPESAVRVMTVHGAKGLQAPVVILADATSDPDFRPSRDLDWQVGWSVAKQADSPAAALTLPIFRPRKAEMTRALTQCAERSDKRERQEHWRLLYVGLTRAEEHLFIGGALTPRQAAKTMGPDCWHMRVGEAMRALDAQVDADEALVHAAVAPPAGERKSPSASGALPVLPDWLLQKAPTEARPPRPLAPSASEVEDSEASPPPDATLRAAAQRGKHLHSLFERLPDVAPDRRRAVATHWLEHSAGVADAAARDALVTDALAVIEDTYFAPLFSPEALAEAPLAGVVGERVIAGTVDRLLVGKDGVLVVDFKTGRRVPRHLSAVPEAHLAQMAAYVAVLRGIFPDRAVKAALLYTSGPGLIVLDDQTVEAHKPGYRDQQDKLGGTS